jgi:hypothetical protein
VLRQSDFIHGVTPCYAAKALDVERRRFGLPPGGLRGPPSSLHKASKISSMVTGAFRPAGARKAGQDAIADASDAQDARMARFSEIDSEGWVNTSAGWSKTVPDAAAR